MPRKPQTIATEDPEVRSAIDRYSVDAEKRWYAERDAVLAELAAKGGSYRCIAKAFGLCFSSVFRAVNRAKRTTLAQVPQEQS